MSRNLISQGMGELGEVGGMNKIKLQIQTRNAITDIKRNKAEQISTKTKQRRMNMLKHHQNDSEVNKRKNVALYIFSQSK